MKLRFLLLEIFLLASLGLQAQQQFHLNGTISGNNVPKIAFLEYNNERNPVRDSSILKNGKFSFTGIITRPVKAYLSLIPLSEASKKLKVGDAVPDIDQIDLMLEPKQTLIEGSSLEISKITGGLVQADYASYKRVVDSTRTSVYEIWKDQQEVLPEDSTAAFKRLMYAQYSKIRQATKNFVLEHPNSQVSYDILTENSYVIEYPNDFELMYEAISPDYKSSPEGKKAGERLVLTKKFAIGQTAADFSQMDNTGKIVTLSKINKGKYVLIDFWASWCGPCRAEYPYLKKAYSKFKEKNFEIIGISLDDKKASWLEAIKSNGFEWIELCDLKGRQNEVANAYGVIAIPQSILLDPNGKIIAKNLRGVDLLEKLEEILSDRSGQLN